MRFTIKTEYGLICLIHMAQAYETKKIVTAREITRQERYSKSFIEKILQTLRHSGIVVAHQGKGGGYALARHPSKITLKDVLEALEGDTFEVNCDSPNREQLVCNHLCMCGLKPVWKKTKEILDGLYESVNLQTLVSNEAELEKVTLVTEENS